MTRLQVLRQAALILVLLTFQACSDDDNDDGDNGAVYDPDIPTSWAPAVTNTFFPLEPGAVWTYLNTGDEPESNRVEVLTSTRVVYGVTATVVHDQVFVDGELIEDTEDWFAQDSAGNVWYLGESTEEYEDGELVSTEGSWEWGVDDALPGIIMWADPATHVGEDYRQEYYEDEAEDWGRVVALNQSATVPFGSLTGLLQTHEFSGLESGSGEEKYYAPGIGFVLETNGGERLELVRFESPLTVRRQ